MALVFQDEEQEEQLLARALYVDPAAVDSDNEDDGQFPATAEEYLRNVIRERRTLDECVVASNKEQLLNAGRATEAAHRDNPTLGGAAQVKELLPDEAWQQKQIASFSHVRLQMEKYLSIGQLPTDLQQLPPVTDERGWCIFFFGPSFWSDVTKARSQSDDGEADGGCDEDGESRLRANPVNVLTEQAPNTSLILSLKSSTICQLLDYQLEWAQLIGLTRPEQGLWIYCLLARIETPLYPDTISTLRYLAKMCISSRRLLAERDLAATLDGQQLLESFNLIICLVARYFHQRDLADCL